LLITWSNCNKLWDNRLQFTKLTNVLKYNAMFRTNVRHRAHFTIDCMLYVRVERIYIELLPLLWYIRYIKKYKTFPYDSFRMSTTTRQNRAMPPTRPSVTALQSSSIPSGRKWQELTTILLERYEKLEVILRFGLFLFTIPFISLSTM